MARTIVGFIVRLPFLANVRPQLANGHFWREGSSNYNLFCTMHKDLVTIIPKLPRMKLIKSILPLMHY
jgi:hypothetical protein